jgi:hypothetical protein
MGSPRCLVSGLPERRPRGEQPRNVGQGHEVSGGRHGALQGERRGDVRVQELRHGVENRPLDAGVALHERVGANEHGGARGGRWQRVALHEHARVQEPDDHLHLRPAPTTVTSPTVRLAPSMATTAAPK